MKARHLAIYALPVLLATACTTGQTTPTTSAPIATTPSTATVETSGSEAGVTEALEAFSGFARAWNENQIDWITALQDPDVSYEEFLTVQQQVAQHQGSLVAGMSLEVARMSPDLQEVFQPIVDHYATRVELSRPLFAAATSGTPEQFDAALLAYQEYTATAFDLMEALFDLPAMQAAAAAEGLTTEDLMEALRLAFGG